MPSVSAPPAARSLGEPPASSGASSSSCGYFPAMRLATFNILHGRSTKDGTVRLDRLADAVRRWTPTCWVCRRSTGLQQRSHLADLTAVAADAMGAVAQQFAAALSGTPGATWVAATGRASPDSASYGIALLSRYPAPAGRCCDCRGSRCGSRCGCPDHAR